MRKYLILVKNVRQAENIVDLFDDGYKIKKECCTGNYVIIKNDKSVTYDILLSGENHNYYRGRRWNGVIECCFVSRKELENNIFPCVIEQYYDDKRNRHLLPYMLLSCDNNEMFLNAIKLIENFDK